MSSIASTNQSMGAEIKADLSQRLKISEDLTESLLGMGSNLVQEQVKDEAIHVTTSSGEFVIVKIGKTLRAPASLANTGTVINPSAKSLDAASNEVNHQNVDEAKVDKRDANSDEHHDFFRDDKKGPILVNDGKTMPGLVDVTATAPKGTPDTLDATGEVAGDYIKADEIGYVMVNNGETISGSGGVTVTANTGTVTFPSANPTAETLDADGNEVHDDVNADKGGPVLVNDGKTVSGLVDVTVTAPKCTSMSCNERQTLMELKCHGNSSSCSREVLPSSNVTPFDNSAGLSNADTSAFLFSLGAVAAFGVAML